jgi:hypothetical protein
MGEPTPNKVTTTTPMRTQDTSMFNFFATQAHTPKSTGFIVVMFYFDFTCKLTIFQSTIKCRFVKMAITILLFAPVNCYLC